jgi:NAD dependent epimerase/dehydratase family enzyme
MKVVIAGGTGFLGQALARRLVDDAHDVVILTRDSTQARPDIAGRLVAWNPSVADGTWTAEIDDADAIVNLAGAGLADRRWTDDRKAELRESGAS